MADNVREELEKEPEIHNQCYGLMKRALRIVGDGLTALKGWTMFADGLIVS